MHHPNDNCTDECDNDDLACGSSHVLSKKPETNDANEPGTGRIISGSYIKVFPNPFSGNTTLEFAISERGHVNFNLYDINGRSVSTLFDGYADNDITYRVKINLEKLPAGIYFAKLMTSSGKGFYKKFINY